MPKKNGVSTKIERRLENRRARYDKLDTKAQRGSTRPGSLNQRKR